MIESVLQLHKIFLKQGTFYFMQDERGEGLILNLVTDLEFSEEGKQDSMKSKAAVTPTFEKLKEIMF